MSLVQLLVFLVVIGVVWYFVRPYVAPPFDKIIVVIAVIIFCLWLLSAFGIMTIPFRLV